MPVYKKHNGKPVVGYKGSEKGLTDPITADVMLWYYQNPDGTDGEPVSLKNENDMLGRMGYQKAKDIRKQSFSDRMAENLIAGGGIGESLKKTISEKSKARMTGIKEAFDPLNIVKKLTGGSRLATSLFGKMTGRSKEHLEYFAGDPKKRKLGQSSSTGIDSETLGESTECLGRIYELLKQDKENKKLQLEKKKSFGESVEEQEELRNQELVKALTARRKKEEKKKKTEKPEPEKKETPVGEEAPSKPSPTGGKKGPKGGGKVKTPTVATPTTPVTKGTPKAPTTKPTAQPAPTVKPTTKPTTTPSATTPIIPSGVSKGAAITGAVIATGSALLGKESLAANISKYESGKAGYNAYNKGTVGNKMIGSDKPIDFSQMKISEYLNRGALKSGDPDKIFAVGKYQIIPKTMKELIDKLKIDPDKTFLDQPTQDLLFAEGLTKIIRKKVHNYVTGKSDDRSGAILELAKEFASVGVPEDTPIKDKSGNVIKVIKKGDSYYSGIGGNKAHNPPEDVGAALDADRLKNIKNKQPEASTNNLGTKIDQSSKENKDLKQTSKNDRPSINVNNNVNTTSHSPTESNTPTMDDRSSYQKKVKGN